MLIKHGSDLPQERSSLKGAKGCSLRWLITEKDGAENYAMRIFELVPGGLIPVHIHEKTEHEIYITEGTAILDNGEDKIPVKKDDVIFVKPGDKHSFINSSSKIFKFICVIPL